MKKPQNQNCSKWPLMATTISISHGSNKKENDERKRHTREEEEEKGEKKEGEKRSQCKYNCNLIVNR